MSERIGRAALPARRRPRAGKLLRTYGTGTLFFLPFFLFFIVFVIVPVVMAIILSATDYNLLQAPNFIGLDNYKTLFLDDDVFLIALKNTLTFAFIAGPLAFILSFLLAWAINQMRCRNLFALAFYVPSILNAIAIGVVWSYIFSPDRFGLINNFLFNLGVINEPILWNMSEKTILPIIIVIHVWMNMGTNFLVMLARPAEHVGRGARSGPHRRRPQPCAGAGLSHHPAAQAADAVQRHHRCHQQLCGL